MANHGEIDRSTLEKGSRTTAGSGARPLQSNKDTLWNDLGDAFWNSYAQRNYGYPLETDLEGLFTVIQNIRDKKGGNFLDVGTGSVPQYAVAAVLAGMKNVTVSDCSKGATDWLKKELLDGDTLSPHIQMWADIAKLLSTFKDKKELSAYSAYTGFGRRMYAWPDLSDQEKKEWFDARRKAVVTNGLSDHFLDADYDIKHKIKEMAGHGQFSIRQFSIHEPPADLAGKADIVTAMYIAENTTAVPSENCQALLNICKLARPETGVVTLGQNANADWKSYAGATTVLPALSRPYSYLATLSSLLLDDTYQTKDTLDEEKKQFSLSLSLPSTPVQPKYANSDVAIDRRPDQLSQVSGIPKETPYQNGEELLTDLHVHLLDNIKYMLLYDPKRRNISPDHHMKSLQDIENSLGIIPDRPDSKRAIYHTDRVKREHMAERIDNIIEHLKESGHSRDTATMNRQDVLFSELVYGVHQELAGHRGGMFIGG